MTFTTGSGRHGQNGLIYLGFPFHMGRGNNRGRGEESTAIEPGHKFTVRCVLPRGDDNQELRRAIVASFWLLGNLGSAGSRGRRGFGSLLLKKWESFPNSSPGSWPELDAHHPHLGNDFQVKLPEDSFALKEWDKALDHMGKLFQSFRQRRSPDYQDVKNHLLARNKEGGQYIQHTPSRATFGMPLSFRFSSTQGSVTFVPYNDEQKSTFERHGSLLHLRTAVINDRLHKELGEALKDWQDASKLEKSFICLWRRYREALVSRNPLPGKGNPLWEEMPSDSRCPDHSIWDHLRVTTALAFLNQKKLPEAQKPWLFRFSIGPVQRFISESRSGRDLWISSFLLSDLIWQAMLPIVEQYGPDCIIYPDLRGNPRVDCWLFEKQLSEKHQEYLPEAVKNPLTFAAVLPNTQYYAGMEKRRNYADKEKERKAIEKSPMETESPIPNFFLSVEKGSEFIFRIGSRSGSKNDLETASDLLEKGLEFIGIGAKTAVGYGVFNSSNKVINISTLKIKR